MDGSWLLEQLTLSPMRAGLWLALSFLLAVITTGVTRLVAPDLESIVRLVRRVQVPYLGLILGGLSPRLMGLTELDWASGFSVGVVLLAALLTLLLLIRILLHTERGPPAADAPPGRSASLLLFESSAQEFHWCFLRGAVWDLLIQPLYSSGGFELGLQSGPEQIQYWAVWIAAALSLPGIGIQRGRMSERLITLLILAATSTLFLYTRNFWLCCLLHLGIRVILQWGQPTRQRAI